MSQKALSADEAEFVGDLCHYVREHLDSFRDAGKRLDDHYSVAAFRQRHESVVEGFRSARAVRFDNEVGAQVKTDEPMYSADFVANAEKGFVAEQAGHRMGEAMSECGSNTTDDALDTQRAEAICLLTWLAWDEHANTILPSVCEFQAMEWHFDPLFTDTNRRQVLKGRIDSAWVSLARKSVSLVKLRPAPLSFAQAEPQRARAKSDGGALPTADRWLRDRAPVIAANLSTLRVHVEKEESELRRRWKAERMFRVRRRRDELRLDLRHHPTDFPPEGRRTAYIRDQLRLEYRQPEDLSTAIFWAAREAVERSKSLYSGRPFSRSFGAWVEFLLFVILNEDAGNAERVSEFQALPNEWPGRPCLLVDMKHSELLDRLLELDVRAWVVTMPVLGSERIALCAEAPKGTGSIDGTAATAPRRDDSADDQPVDLLRGWADILDALEIRASPQDSFRARYLRLRRLNLAHQGPIKADGRKPIVNRAELIRWHNGLVDDAVAASIGADVGRVQAKSMANRDGVGLAEIGFHIEERPNTHGRPR
jgi:hypothetical protein